MLDVNGVLSGSAFLARALYGDDIGPVGGYDREAQAAPNPAKAFPEPEKAALEKWAADFTGRGSKLNLYV